MSRNTRLLLTIPAIALLLGAAAPDAAHAGFRWAAHGSFRVGGIDFSLGFHHGHPRFGPVPYYRIGPSLSYRGVACGDVCYRHEGYSYHHAACPLMRHHFALSGFAPPAVFGGHLGFYGHFGDSGRYGPSRGHGVYRYYGRDRGHGFDRHHRRGRDHGVYRHYGRDRGHRGHDIDRRGRRGDRRFDSHRGDRRGYDRDGRRDRGRDRRTDRRRPRRRGGH